MLRVVQTLGGRRGPWPLTLGAAACCVIALLAPSVADAGPLLPDLKPVKSGAPRLCQEMTTPIRARDACTGTGRTVIRNITKTGNAGPGPLELAAVAPEQDIPADCNGDGNPANDVMVKERIYTDANGDGVYQRSVDTTATSSLVGCRYYHAIHKHYHLERFVSFHLVDAATGLLVGGNNKVSFCISDSNPFDLALPGAPSGQYYSPAACTPRDTVTGVSIGWADTYGWKIQGQEIDVTGLPAADYCVVTVSDPANLIVESNEANNFRAVRYRIDPAQAPRNGSVPITPASGGCPAPVSAASGLLASASSGAGGSALSPFVCRLDAAAAAS
jgi:Lysyl oxidase